MASISSSNYYSAASGTSGNGIAGLASGMDTEALVEKMLSGTQNKINKQEALKQQETWKQEIYRDIISNINGFYGKYFDSRYGASSINNFASTSFFDTMLSAVSRGDAVKVISSSSSANTGDIRVAVKNLATNSKMQSTEKMSTGRTIKGKAVSLESLDDALSKKVVLDVNGTDMSVDLSNVKNETELVATFNKAFADNSVDATAKMVDGRLRFVTGAAGTKITVDSEKSATLGLRLTGFNAASYKEVKDKDGIVIGNMVQGSSVVIDSDYTLTMSLDGIEKTIAIKGVADPVTGKITAESVKKSLEEEINRAFGTYVDVDLSGDPVNGYKFGFSLASGNSGHELKVTGENLNILGITPGASTTVNGTTKLSDLGGTGDSFKFTINGKEFSFTGDDTVGSVINKVNNSGAGVKLSYSSVSDTFKMESTSTGAGYDIDIDQTEGDILSVMFGDKVKASDNVTSRGFTTSKINGTDIPNDFTAKEMKMRITVNGETRIFSLPKKEDDGTYNKTEITTKLNEWLKETYETYTGTDGSEVQNIELKNGNLEIAKGFRVSFAGSTVDMDDAELVEKAKETDLALLLGFNKTATSNNATKDTAISDIYEFSGSVARKADGTVADKLGEIDTIDGIKVSVTDEGRIKVQSNVDVDLTGSPALKEIFGKDRLVFSDGTMDANAVEKGVDAVITVNGEDTTRSSNTIVVDGVTMELSKVSPVDSAGKHEETVVTTTRDVDTIVEGFKTFVEDYNKMIDKLNGYMNEEPNYKEYPPLTTEQKKEMSENEVKLWEENAKKGLVRRDSTVEQFLSEMRLAVYSKPVGGKLALYNIGIETTASYKDGGKLQFNEAALRKAITDDPAAVKELFTDSVGGISKTMMGAMDRAAKESSGSAGTLVKLAGTSKVLTKNNTIYDRITDIKTRIYDLKVKYNKERQRYWQQFSNMESVLSNYNQQSMMFSNQMGGY